MKKVLFYMDQESHEPLYLALYSDQWDSACAKLSGDGADTQLVNALGELGFAVLEKRASDADADDEDSDNGGA